MYLLWTLRQVGVPYGFATGASREPGVHSKVSATFICLRGSNLLVLKCGVPLVEICDMTPIHKGIGRMAENRVVYRTVIADDSEEFRDWLRPILEGDSDFQVIGEASSGKETLEICLHLQPDLLIMDVFMPDGEGTQVAGVLQRRAPKIKIILISATAGAVYERLAQSQGAVGFIPKIDLTINALKAVLEKG